MYCVIKCYVRGNQARIKNTDLRHPSCTVIMYRHKSASPVLIVLSSSQNVLVIILQLLIKNICRLYNVMSDILGIIIECVMQ